MHITYSKRVEAIYIYLLNVPFFKMFGVVKKTEGDWPIHFDYTKDNKLFGIEILESKRYFSGKTLEKIIRKDKSAPIDMVNDLRSFKPEDEAEKECVKKACDILVDKYNLAKK